MFIAPLDHPAIDTRSGYHHADSLSSPLPYYLKSLGRPYHTHKKGHPMTVQMNLRREYHNAIMIVSISCFVKVYLAGLI